MGAIIIHMFAYVHVISLIPFRMLVAIANNWYQMALNLEEKFKVGKFDGTENFKLWHRRVKDLLA